MHKRRLQALMDCTRALMRSRVLSVTGIGRALDSASWPKHNINAPIAWSAMRRCIRSGTGSIGL